MIEEILPGLYKIEIPIPNNPLKAVNSYVIKSQRRNLIIDTAMNQKKCASAMRLSLNELDINLVKTDFFITHLHADHFGLVPNLATDTSRVYFNQPDADLICAGGHWDISLNFFRLNGFPVNELQKAIEKHPGYRYGAKGDLKFTILKEGDTISIGDYLFKCIETPGHTKGHMCLYEPGKKFLMAGDHILGDITPNISQWFNEDNPLSEYLKSLDKVYEYDIELVLPGHRDTFRDCKGRIRELKRHHQMRADEILLILEEGIKDAFQVASLMSWDMTYDSWDQFPMLQKMFATGEAIAHLNYLAGKGLIRRENLKQRILFSFK